MANSKPANAPKAPRKPRAPKQAELPKPEAAEAPKPAEQAMPEPAPKPLPTVEERAARICRAIDKLLAMLDDLEEPYSGPNAERFKRVKPASLKGKRDPQAASTALKPVDLVWQICAKMHHEGAKRSEIQAACEAAGINKWTARTQIQACLKQFA